MVSHAGVETWRLLGTEPDESQAIGFLIERLDSTLRAHQVTPVSPTTRNKLGRKD